MHVSKQVANGEVGTIAASCLLGYNATHLAQYILWDSSNSVRHHFQVSQVFGFTLVPLWYGGGLSVNS